MTIRACMRHRCELLEDGESCPHGHFCEEWLVIQHGVAVAEVRHEGVIWLQPDGKLEHILVPDPDLKGRRPFRMDAAVSRRDKLRADRRRRQVERERAKREGRQPAEWAVQRHGPQFEEADASFMRGSRFRRQQMRAEEDQP